MRDDPGHSTPPGFWSVVGLLLRAARKRALGRQKRQQELFRHRARKSSVDWSRFGLVLGFFFMALIHLAAGYVVYSAVASGKRLEAEHSGKVVVSRSFLKSVQKWEKEAEANLTTLDKVLSPSYRSEARNIERDYGGHRAEIEKKLQEAVNHHRESLVPEDRVSEGFKALPGAHSLPALLGSLALIWWVVMLVFQGEGLELDLQRRRHPMWEWLFSHPIPSGAIFLAEMLSPIVANPIYCSAPVFAGFLYGFVYGPWPGLAAALLIGLPLAAAAACLGKALETGTILRFSPRSRGAVTGFMSWIGYASMMLFILFAFTTPRVVTFAEPFLKPLTVIPWPWLGLFLGQSGGSFSFLAGMLACWIFAAVVIAGAVGFSVWGAQQGLGGNFGGANQAPAAVKHRGIRFGREPLYRKEFLWFIRDRSAIVQVFLIPLTVAGVQLFNLRGILVEAQSAWNYLCGAGILFGTYFLWILGPKSLASEGNALWIALTWPRGMEALLKAKAWLWSLISYGIVGIVLAYAAFLYPEDAWKIALVGVGWFFFGRSMAEKTVTLVSVNSSSGEPEKISWGRRLAAQLGMMTFALGIMTRQWHIALMGIAYSVMTAAAIWENFRARLPYLFDPWSEKLPQPPTLMHAMIAISVLVEGGAVLTGIALAIVGRENIAVAQPAVYGVFALIIAKAVAKFLYDRGVPHFGIWNWENNSPKPWWCGNGSRAGLVLSSLLLGTAGGLGLGFLAQGYLALVQYIPSVAEMIGRARDQISESPDLWKSYAIIAVAFAPIAEEYLFRGLLFRALDREWGGWKAVLGSAAFFAIYHPPLSWLPVGLLGIANALLFKKTGRLGPAIVLHMVYNAVVVVWRPW